MMMKSAVFHCRQGRPKAEEVLKAALVAHSAVLRPRDISGYMAADVSSRTGCTTGLCQTLPAYVNLCRMLLSPFFAQRQLAVT